VTSAKPGALVHDAAVQAKARVGGDLGAAISDHLWAVERIRPMLAGNAELRILDDDVLLADRLARAVLALDRPVVPSRERLVQAASAAVFDHAPADRALRPSEIIALAVDAVLAVLDRA
jgi:hypothetical protein